MKKYNVAVVGATGAVGQEMIKTLIQRRFPINEIKLFASARSKGKKLKVDNNEVLVEELTETSFVNSDIDVALFSAGAERSRKFAPIAAKNGVIVIDNSSAFRMDPDVPLVVPEVNPEDVKKHNNIIANPNCSTIQMVVTLKPIHDYAKIKRIVVSTYQSVSGAGMKAMYELENQTREFLEKKDLTIEKFPYQIAFNCIPQIDVFLDNGYTKEEEKMVNETKKILGDDSIKVSATTVRVPVFRGHAESVNIETEKKVSVEKAFELLSQMKGVTVIDDIKNLKYPLQCDCEGKDDVFVGRIREDFSIEKGLNLWVVSDNLRKGAALNAVQIAETLIEFNLI